MKKVLILVFFFWSTILLEHISNMFALHEGGKDLGPQKTFRFPDGPGTYENPTTEEQAVEEWDKAEKGESAAQDAQQEVQKEYDKAVKDLQKAKGKKDAFTKAGQRVNELWDELEKFKKVTNSWSDRKTELRKNELVKKIQ